MMTNRSHCRVCGSELPAPYLDLGEQPLANALRSPHDRTPERTAPLAVAKCPTCHLSQLTVVVDPAILFHRDYPFRSGTSAAWREHCQAFAESFGRKDDLPLDARPLVIDVAANDGTQLAPFQEAGWRVVGVDPACLTDDLPFVHRLWDKTVASDVMIGHGMADLIIGQNVLGHVNDPVAFLRACALALSWHGRLVIEVPHVGELLDQCAFDTIYHEHLSYWSLLPLEMAAEAAGLVVVDVERLEVHGGSRRYWLAHRPHAISTRVMEEREADAGLASDAPYTAFRTRVLERLAGVKDLLESVAGKRTWAYGASAKGAVMLNSLCLVGNQVWPTRIIDDTPAKVGLRIPGLGTRVLAMPDSLALIDVLWILSWNITDSLIRRAREHGFRGQFLVTHPTPRLLDG